MSQSTAVATRPAARSAPRPVARPASRVPAARLRVVSAPARARSRAGLVVMCLALLGVGLVGLLLLNLSLEKGAFDLHAQVVELQYLNEQQQTLQEELAALGAPQSLAARATALGMVEAPNVAFVDKGGRILGVGSPGVARRPAIVTPSGSSAGGHGAATGPGTGAAASTKGSAGPAGKATTSTKVTATGRLAATTTATSSGKPASSAGAAKAPASASRTAPSTAAKAPATRRARSPKPATASPAAG